MSGLREARTHCPPLLETLQQELLWPSEDDELSSDIIQS
jgi:hypothetical protein